jgi:hypothetical protein
MLNSHQRVVHDHEQQARPQQPQLFLRRLVCAVHPCQLGLLLVLLLLLELLLLLLPLPSFLWATAV